MNIDSTTRKADASRLAAAEYDSRSPLARHVLCLLSGGKSTCAATPAGTVLGILRDLESDGLTLGMRLTPWGQLVLSEGLAGVRAEQSGGEG